jgi:hypothetical protein
VSARDRPLAEVALLAAETIDQGARVYQQWTCIGCGQRVVANDPNHFTMKGHHEECGRITDLVEACGFMAVWERGEPR